MTVTEINSYINRTLKFDPILNNALIVGELSNFKAHSSGHLYFSLKDGNSKITCVMFRGDAASLDYNPSEGEKTEIRGSIGVYEKEGKYQVYVTQMAPIGKGELYKAFLKLKEALLLEGYFNKKRPLIPYPKKIGIVTSITSAALQDMLKVLKRRNPLVEIQIYPATVQGDKAVSELVMGIDYFNEQGLVDAIIIGRGGGSIEELWAFNALELAESIYASKIPVVSGVGHETDFTISDFVADHRAATPTEAAELITAPLKDLSDMLQRMLSRLIHGVEQARLLAKIKLENHSNTYLCQLVEGILIQKNTNIDSLLNIIHNSTNDVLKLKRNELDLGGALLNSLSPLNTLTRGYAILEKDDDVISDINQVQVSDRIDITVKNGIIRTEVISKEGKL